MKKLMWLGIALIASGVLSAILEQVFYGGRLDENNVVQESFFLPLAFILIFLGGGLLIVVIGRHLAQRFHRSDS